VATIWPPGLEYKIDFPLAFIEYATDGGTGEALLKMMEDALEAVGVDDLFTSVVGAFVDGADLIKLRFKLSTKVTGQFYNTKNAKMLP